MSDRSFPCRMPAHLLAILLFQGLVTAAIAAAPTYQDLMNPSVFPEPQRGMVVEMASATTDALQIVTSGAGVTFNANGDGVFRQRIGHERDVLRMRIEGVTKTPILTHASAGLAFAQFDSPKLDVRANGDSLFMFHAREPVTIEISRGIDVGFTASYKSNCLVLDEWGGYGLFSSDNAINFGQDVYASQPARYTLAADAVLWVGICPPKPYDWKRSISDTVVWHWSMTTGYPADADLIAWQQEGNIVLLQSEVMLWKDWNLAFEPRLGAAEFARVRKTLHDRDMRFIVYTSPYYFLKDTPIESKAMNSFENFAQRGFPPGWPSGVNIDQFVNEIKKVMTEYKPDGLYFDGQYTENTPALYALARRAREVVGEDGILEWHSTAALGDGLCFLPQADAYVDFILRGEGQEKKYGDFNYFRYFVSGYNASNSIGVLCNNSSKPTSAEIDQLLSVNGRMHTIAGWLAEPALIDVVHTEYRARLTGALQAEADKGVDERQARIAEISRTRAAEQRALQAPPAWGVPAIDANPDALLQWTPSVSATNPNPFALQDGALAITARAHTCAFLTQPLSGPLQGIVCKLKQDTDGGMSWGPAVCIRWPGGIFLRVGLRSDGTLQVDYNGAQFLVGRNDPKEWIWVRARWLREFGVVESSSDGIAYQPIWTFAHDGKLLGLAENVSVGKVPYNGSAADNADPGAPGVCQVESLQIYP